jgi:hypothetical protein
MKRTERLFALAEYLRGRRTGVTAEALAERFEVTVRTIYRDLDSLRAAALPLGAERGPGGGYALDRNYSLPPVNFTAREAALLVALGRYAIDMRLLPFVDTVESALDKVRAALSTSAQRELLTRLTELSFHGVPVFQVWPKLPLSDCIQSSRCNYGMPVNQSHACDFSLWRNHYPHTTLAFQPGVTSNIRVNGSYLLNN